MDRDRIFVLALASVLLLLFFACENQQKRIYSSVLQSIDSLTYTSPKRALARLDSLDSCTDRQCVELSMWAKLLRLKARYKDYQSVDTDETPSIIRYYEDHGSVYQKMNAQYIAGAYWVEDSVGVSTLFGDLYDYKARYYMGVGKMDSALCFQRKLSQVAVTYYDKVKLYSNYQDLYDELGNSDSLCKYSKLYCQYNDSTMANLNVERVAQIQSLYNYDRSLKEMYRQKKVKTLVILCGTVTVVLFLFVMLWQWRMGKKERRKIVSEIIAQREAYGNLLEAYRKKSKQLDLLMSGKDIRAEELLQESIGKLRKELVDNFAMKVFPKEWVCGSLLVRQLHSLAEEGKHPSDELWLQVEKELALNEENFMEWLTNCRKDKKLKEREWRMCLLVKMCFLPVEMAVLLVTSKQNVSNMRSRLVQKIFGQNGRSGEFDILISEL